MRLAILSTKTNPLEHIFNQEGGGRILECTQNVYINGTSSDDRPLKYGVPQGLILGPKLFKVYTLPAGDITRRHGLQYQIYADDNNF